MHNLRSLLKRIHNNSYKLYKSIKNSYQFEGYTLRFDHIQADPFAPPSKVTVIIPLSLTGFPADLYNDPCKSVAFRDTLARTWARLIRKVTSSRRGTGNSGIWAINYGNQKVLDRNSVIIKGQDLHIRLMAGLPARGRNIDGPEARDMFFTELPEMVRLGLYWAQAEKSQYHESVRLKLDQACLRSQLPEKGLLAFLANGSRLARMSGIEDLPLKDGVELKAPPRMEVSLKLANGKEIKGLGIPRGITLITGGGFHGKSTLLNAIQAGIYDHVAGDGREYVLSDPDLVKIRAEDGRSVKGVDISSFIAPLPGNKSTLDFDTDNASGSTSQAANIMESLEAGAKVLLIDEDSSATNFLIRDLRMRELIPAAREPITPFIDRVRDLWENHGVSTVMAIGGSGDYLDVADQVLLMDQYRVQDATERAKELVQKYPYAQVHKPAQSLQISQRCIDNSCIDPSHGKREEKIGRQGKAIQFGKQLIDLSAYEHLVDLTQYDTIARILSYAAEQSYFTENRTLYSVLQLAMQEIQDQGLDVLKPDLSYGWDYLCQVRPLDVAAALNRLRSLRLCKV